MTSFKKIKELLRSQIDEFTINESLDSDFEVYRHENLERLVNRHTGEKIHPDQTRVYQSQHMHDNKHAVMRLMNNNNDVEYHIVPMDGNFFGQKLDPKSMAHTIKIVHDNAKADVESGRRVVLQGRTERQHQIYGKIANRFAQKYGRKVTELDSYEKTDGTGAAKAHIVESVLTDQHPAQIISEIIKNEYQK